MRVARRVLESPEPVEERRDPRLERLEELQGVAGPLGRDPRRVKGGGGRREELVEAGEAAGEAPPGAPAKGLPGPRARGERPTAGSGEAPPPAADGLSEPRELRGVDAERGELAREDLPEDVLVLGPLREERSPDLLGAEGREAPAEVAGRFPERVGVPRFGTAAKEAGGRLEASQGDPDVVNERRVVAPARAILEPAQPLRQTRERVLQDRENRAGSTVRQGGPPPPS